MDFDELDKLPKRLILELSAKALGPYAAELRSRYRKAANELKQQKAKVARAEQALEKARMACKRLTQISGRGLICHYCSAEDDLRPYGPKGAVVCFDCAMATPERRKETEVNFSTQLNASGPVAVLDGTNVGPYPIKHLKET